MPDRMLPTAFLEAPAVTQDLLTLKWLLRSAGYKLASTWHEASPIASIKSSAHWTRARMEEINSFDTLVVLRHDQEEVPAELALGVGFAVARKVNVIWIGVPIESLGQFGNVDCFSTLEEFKKYLALEKHSQPKSPKDSVQRAA